MVVVFDMDGVLVDVTGSYRAAIAATVRTCVSKRGGWTPAADAGWADPLKRAGGFNNDWDLSFALVRGALAAGSDFDPASFGDALAAGGGGMTALASLLGPEPSLDYAWVQSVFQDVYVGSGRLIDRERLLLGAETLNALSGPFAVATGRPRDEARYTLDRFGLGGAFSACVTHDCVVEAGAEGKPDPWPLLEARRRLAAIAPDVLQREFWYVGDTGDDMRAARAAGFRAVGVSGRNEDVTRALQAAGAEVVIDHVNLLARAF